MVKSDPGLKKMSEAQHSYLSVPVYGRYCGPKNSGPGAPVDSVDSACYRHDYCYATRGYFNCACDKKLYEELGTVLQRDYSILSNMAYYSGRMIRSFYSLVPCSSK